MGAGLQKSGPSSSIQLNLSVRVGFIALFGITTDSGVLIVAYLKQIIKRKISQGGYRISIAVSKMAQRRIFSTLITTSTTSLSLPSTLTSRDRGRDIIVSIAIPSLGGMFVALLTISVFLVLYCTITELQM